MSADLRPRVQCIQTGFHLEESINYRSSEVILKLYLLIRPQLDIVVQFRPPCYRMEIKIIESVQRRIAKCNQGMKNLSHEDRFEDLNLHFLERQCARIPNQSL